MPCAYKDFNKASKDVQDTGSAVEQKLKFTTKTVDGTKFEATQTRRTEDDGRDKAGRFSNFCIKFGKGKGFNLDEFSVATDAPDAGSSCSKGTSKWSLGGVVPNGKIKAKVTHDMSQLVPSKVNLSLDYGDGPLKAAAGVTRKVQGANCTEWDANAVFASGDFTVGAALAGAAGAKSKPLDANIALAYAMGDMKFVAQTSKNLSVINAHYYNKVNSSLEVASTTTLTRSTGAVSQTLGAAYQIDGDSSTNVALDLGKVTAFDSSNVGISAVYSAKVRSYATLNASCAINLGETDSPKFGWNMEFA